MIPEFSTRDLYLASTLVTLGHKMLGLDIQIEGIKVRAIGYFKFEDSSKLQEDKNNYTQGRVLVEPRLFVQNLQSLKSEVINMQNNPSFK